MKGSNDSFVEVGAQSLEAYWSTKGPTFSLEMARDAILAGALISYIVEGGEVIAEYFAQERKNDDLALVVKVCSNLMPMAFVSIICVEAICRIIFSLHEGIASTKERGLEITILSASLIWEVVERTFKVFGDLIISATGSEKREWTPFKDGWESKAASIQGLLQSVGLDSGTKSSNFLGRFYEG